MKILYFMILGIGLFSGQLYAQHIPLADEHRVVYDEKQWHYVQSESTLKKSVALLELKKNDDIKGMIDTEVRFTNKKDNITSESFLARQCKELKEYWPEDKYIVEQQGQYCVVYNHAKSEFDKFMFQVIEARVARSRSDMIFIHTWTFHFGAESLKEAHKSIKELMGAQS